MRKQLKEDGSQPVPSYNDLLAKLIAQALLEHPMLNARFEGDTIVQAATVNIGVAVDTDRGLLVPVLRDVQTKSLRQIARESAALIEQARTGRITVEELQGGTFTITNLGMYEIDAFTPIINLPECAILGVGRIVPKQVVVDAEAERVAIRHMVFLSLTFDHRLVDGAPAARFLQTGEAVSSRSRTCGWSDEVAVRGDARLNPLAAKARSVRIESNGCENHRLSSRRICEISNHHWVLRVGVDGWLNPRYLFDVERNRPVADEAYAYDLTLAPKGDSGFTGGAELTSGPAGAVVSAQRVRFREWTAADLPQGGKEVRFTGRFDFGLLGPTDIEIEHVFRLPDAGPWFEEQIGLRHRFGRDLHEVRHIRFGFRKTLFDRDSQSWLHQRRPPVPGAGATPAALGPDCGSRGGLV